MDGAIARLQRVGYVQYDQNRFTLHQAAIISFEGPPTALVQRCTR
jgi:hypothetical protein